MPQEKGIERAPTFSEGLYDRAAPLLITEKHASETKNLNFDTLSVEEAQGYRRLNAARPPAGAIRFKPISRRSSIEKMTRWRDGYAYAPLTKRLETEPQCIEAHCRLEESVVWPESGPVSVTRIHGGLTGRFSATIGTQRIGGEHQYFPLVSRGAREVERPHFTFGIGVVRPEGLMAPNGTTDDSSPDAIVPIFAWWDSVEQRLRVACADFPLASGVDYHLAVDIGPASSFFYVNGVAVVAMVGFGLSALPVASHPLFTTPSLLPIYFGRTYTREPGIKYDDPSLPNPQTSKKHAYMGKLNCRVDANTAGTIGIFGEGLAFAAATASSYVGYRIRVVTGATAGSVFVITSTTFQGNDAAITFALPNPHNIVVGNIVDIIPAIEPMPAEVSLQEVRLWNVSQGATQIAKLANLKLFTDTRLKTFDKGPALEPDFGNIELRELIAYWPMDDDGGAICRDLAGRSDAFLAPSALAIQDKSGASSSPRTLFLDGETQAIQIDLSRDPNYKLNWVWNLGKTTSTENQWNVCARMQVTIGGDMEATSNGNLEDHLYQTLFSLGNPKTGVPILEARITHFGPNGLHVYFRAPDGTFHSVNAPLVPGRFYNAIVGIEAPPGLMTHYVYFQFIDADLLPLGGFSAGINLKRVEINPATDYVLTFGASTHGAPLQGVSSNNHALIGLACLGVGHHPAHSFAKTIIPTGSLQGIVPIIRFSEVKERTDIVIPITGQDGGATLVEGSRVITVASQDNLPSYLRRFALEAEHVTLTIVERGELDKHVPNAVTIAAVSGSEITVMGAHQSRAIVGAEIKAQVWAAYTDFATFDPAFDTDLNAACEPGQTWALTKAVFKNIVGGVLRFDIAIDPGYEFVSPLRVIPEWGPGIVVRCDAKIRVLKQFKNARRAGLMAVSAGSLFEVDDRWRRDNPWRTTGFSFEFRVRPSSARRSLITRRESASILVTEERPYRNEAIAIFEVRIQGATDGEEVIEADIKLFSLDGRQTISGLGFQKIQLISSVRRWAWTKNHHFYVSNGDLVFEIVEEVNATFVRARTEGNPAIRQDEWTRVSVSLTWSGSVLTAVTFRVNGKAVPSNFVTSGGFLQGDVPPLFGGLLGSIGSFGATERTAFVDVLNGRMAGYIIRRQADGSNWPFFGVDYEPEEILDDDVLGFGFTQGHGAQIVAKSGLVGTYLGDECIPTGHGMGPPTNEDEGDQEVSMVVFGEAIYINTGFTRPWRWDFEEFTASGLREPAGRLRTVTVTKIPMRTKDGGADLPALIGRGNRADLITVVPQLGAAFTGTAPTPSEADKGALVYVPASPVMGAATDYPCGYIGVVAGFILTPPTYSTLPFPVVEQVATGAGELAWMLFRTKVPNVPTLLDHSYFAAVQLLKSTTPWGERRLLCDGKDDNSAPETEGLVEGPTNPSCFHFRGNVYLETGPFRTSTMPLARGKVLSIKGYIKVDVQTSFGDEQVVWELAKDGDSGVRIVLFDGGRLRFQFYDTLLAGFRSIQTVGKVISPGQWFYLHFRYRFKQKGSSALDTKGGWEPDLRWTRKTVAGTQLSKKNDFRDQLLIYACEGLHQINPLSVGGYDHMDTQANYFGDVEEGAPHMLLTLPGSESTIGGNTVNGTQATHNHSQHLLNGGLMKDAPYITPEPGDSLFPAGVLPESPRSGIAAVLLSNIITNIQVGGTPSVGSSVGGAPPSGAVPQFQLPAGFCLPRSCSMNRSDAWNRELGSIEVASSLMQKAGGAVTRNFWNSLHIPASTFVHNTPNLAGYGLVGGASCYGKQELTAVLVRVWSMVGAGGGPGVPGDRPNNLGVGVPRVLALVHLDVNDVGVSSVGGISAHRIFVTDDPAYGGDGLGNLTVTAAAAVPSATSTWHITIELPNGSNQAPTSTNRSVCPSLLEHGPNPVGVDDSPDPTLAPMRFGGTKNQNEDGVVRSGFKGFLDDVGILIANLAHSDTLIYTADCLPPDAFFTGPKDTRFQSLPRLAFTNNALIIDDPSGAAATLPSVVFRFDELSGGAVAKDATFSSNEATSLQVVKAEVKTLQIEGEHRFRVTFYDPRQDVESKPGEEFLVTIEGEQGGGGDFVDAETLFTLEGIPISGDRRHHMARRIYKTLPESGLPLRLATIKDGTTSSITPYQDDVVLASQEPLQFDNGRPPRCRGIACNEQNMIYAGIDDAPNVVAISKAFKPEHVSGVQIQYGESGRGGPLVAANFISTMLVVGKRNALFIIVPSGSAFRMHRIGQAVGVLAHNGMADVDGTLYFPSQKGIYTFAGNQRSYEATEMIQRLYLNGLDIKALAHAAGAHLADRGQYLVLVTRNGDIGHHTILTAEQRFNQFGDRYYVWGVLEPGVALSAITEFEDDYAEAGRVAIGTEVGIVGRHDTGDGVLRDADPMLSFDQTGVVTTGSGKRGKLQITGSFDSTKEAIVGIPVVCLRWLNTLGQVVPQAIAEDFQILEQDEVVLARNNVGNRVDLYTRNHTNWQARQNETVYLGQREWVIRSKWFSLDQLEAVKRWNKLDLYFDPVQDQFVIVELYVDHLPTRNAVFRVDLIHGMCSLPVDSQFFRMIQFRIKGFGYTQSFHLHNYAWRGDEAEYAQRQKV